MRRPPEVRFLVDQNVPQGVAEALRQAGHLADHTSELGLSRADDADLLRFARGAGAVVITFDHDFPRLLAFSGDAKPSVIHLRLGPEHLIDLNDRVVNAVRQGWDFLDSGAILVVEPRGVRSRPLPVV